MKLRCLIGVHVWDLVATENGCYWTGFGDNDYIHLSFYRCSHCGKRRATATKNIRGIIRNHKAASAYMERWQLAGYLPSDANTTQPRAKLVEFPGGKEGK